MVTGLRFIAPLLLVLTASATAATGGYSLDPAGGIDTPDRSFTWEGETFRASEVAAVDPGEDIALDVAGPGNETVRVYLYDFERRIQATRRVSPPDRVTFSSTGLTPGTYLAAVYREGTFEAVQPVAVSGYRLEVTEAPDSAAAGSTTTIQVRVTGRDGAPELHSVRVGAANAEHSATATAVRRGGDTFAAELELRGLPPGEYRVYGVALGNRTLEGRREGLGLSEGVALTVTDATESSDIAPSSDGSGVGGASFDAPDPTETATETISPTPGATDLRTARPETPRPTEPVRSSREPLQPDLDAPPAPTSTAPLPLGVAVVALAIAALVKREW